MGFISNIFGKSKSKKYGEEVSNLILSIMKEEVEGNSDTKSQMKEFGIDYNRDRYIRVVFELYIRLTLFHIVTNLSHKIADEGKNKDLRKLVDTIYDNIPDFYFDSKNMDNSIIIANKLVLEERPVLTASRLAAQDYIGGEVGVEEVTYFGSISKAFLKSLREIEEEVGL